MPGVLLETARLALRRFRLADLEHIYQLDNDPDVMRYINGGIPVARSVIENEIFPGFLKVDPQHPEYGFWAVEEKTSEIFLGWLSFRPTGGDPLEVTLGFRLRRAAWGKGYATEGARALLHKGFTELKVRRVRATTYEQNWRSRRLMEKIGMKCVRRFRLTPEDLEKSDTFYVESLTIWDGFDVLYAVDIADWKANFEGSIVDR